MKKAIFFLLIVSNIIVFCAGCGGKTISVDINDASQELLDSGVFTDLLSPIDADIATTLYDINEEDVIEAVVFCSTGATAEEVAMFVCSDDESAGRVAVAANERIEKQRAAFESYRPAEIPKLDEAIVMRSGVYVILVISAQPDQASKALERMSG